MYYVYIRNTGQLVARYPLGTELMLMFYNPTKYEVVIW